MRVDPTQMNGRGREGFSVLEAIISLAISALALTLVYSIGDHASQMGFNLGRRIIRTSDADLEIQTLSALVAGMDVPTGLGRAASPEDISGNFEGDAKALSSSALLAVDTACAPRGPVEKLTLSVAGQPGKETLVCQANGAEPRVVLRLDNISAEFSYSRDGQTWVRQIDVQPGVLFPDELGDPLRGRFVYVRLTSAKGRVLFLGRAWSQRPRYSAKSLEDL